LLKLKLKEERRNRQELVKVAKRKRAQLQEDLYSKDSQLRDVNAKAACATRAAKSLMGTVDSKLRTAESLMISVANSQATQSALKKRIAAVL